MAKPKLEVVTVTATKMHYDLAIHAAETGNKSVLTTCLVAQAVRGLFPRKKVFVNCSTASVGNDDYTLSKKGQSVINRFDGSDAQRKGLRKALPISFRMTLQAQGVSA